MKFGKSLQNDSSERWQGKYLDYKRLKKLIKSNQVKFREGSLTLEEAMEIFYPELSKECKKINDFFEEQKKTLEERLEKLSNKIKNQNLKQTTEYISNLLQELFLVKVLVVSMGEYVTLNVTGFKKITKKFDKQFDCHTSQDFLESYIYKLSICQSNRPFAELEEKITWKISHVSESLSQTSGDNENRFGNLVLDALGNGDEEFLSSPAAREWFAQEGNCDSLFISACRSNLIDSVKNLIENYSASPSYLTEVSQQNCIHVCCKQGYVELLEYLLTFPVDVNLCDTHGKYPIHYAVTNGELECVKLLMKSSDANFNNMDSEGNSPLFYAIMHENIEIVTLLLDVIDANVVCSGLIRELMYFELPLFLATRIGNEEIVKILLKKGKAAVSALSPDGENALHVACRVGNVPIATILIENGININQTSLNIKRTPLMIASRHGFADVVKLLLDHSADTRSKDASSLNAYAHAVYRWHADVVNLLKPITRDDICEVSFPIKTSTPKPTRSHSATDKDLLIILIGERLSKPVLDFFSPVDVKSLKLIPRNARTADFQIRFPMHYPEGVELDLHGDCTLDIVNRYSLDMIGSIFIMPPTEGQSSYQTNLSSFIVDHNMKAIGKFNYNMLKVSTCHHQLSKSESKEILIENFPLIGHRGSGAAAKGKKNSINVQENTNLSFVTAANYGAKYVEFDVQLTKDEVPVIYHDFIASESSYDLPISRMTLKEFRQMKSKSQRLKSNGRLDAVDDLLKNFVSAPFTSLENSLKNVPEEVGFNIEMKVPLVSEAIEHNFKDPDIDRYANIVLKCVFNHAGNRNIVFSCFHPDVCLAIAKKQSRYPIFLLTSSGVYRYDDIRLNSLHGAVTFAKQNNILGVVSESSPFLACPQLVKVVKSSGLLCVTWGDENNSISAVKLQQAHGVDAVIMDHVHDIKKGLETVDILT